MRDLAAHERKAITMLLAGDCPALPILRKQLEHCTVERRCDSDGYIARLFVDPSVPSAPLRGRQILSGVHAAVPELVRGIAFKLFVREGRLSELEGATFGESMPSARPEELVAVDLEYLTDPVLLDRSYPPEKLD